jgi:hypothetical protein
MAEGNAPRDRQLNFLLNLGTKEFLQGMSEATQKTEQFENNMDSAMKNSQKEVNILTMKIKEIAGKAGVEIPEGAGFVGTTRAIATSKLTQALSFGIMAKTYLDWRDTINNMVAENSRFINNYKEMFNFIKVYSLDYDTEDLEAALGVLVTKGTDLKEIVGPGGLADNALYLSKALNTDVAATAEWAYEITNLGKISTKELKAMGASIQHVSEISTLTNAQVMDLNRELVRSAVSMSTIAGGDVAANAVRGLQLVAGYLDSIWIDTKKVTEAFARMQDIGSEGYYNELRLLRRLGVVKDKVDLQRQLSADAGLLQIKKQSAIQKFLVVGVQSEMMELKQLNAEIEARKALNKSATSEQLDQQSRLTTQIQEYAARRADAMGLDYTAAERTKLLFEYSEEAARKALEEDKNRAKNQERLNESYDTFHTSIDQVWTKLKSIGLGIALDLMDPIFRLLNAVLKPMIGWLDAFIDKMGWGKKSVEEFSDGASTLRGVLWAIILFSGPFRALFNLITIGIGYFKNFSYVLGTIKGLFVALVKLGPVRMFKEAITGLKVFLKNAGGVKSLFNSLLKVGVKEGANLATRGLLQSLRFSLKKIPIIGILFSLLFDANRIGKAFKEQGVIAGLMSMAWSVLNGFLFGLPELIVNGIRWIAKKIAPEWLVEYYEKSFSDIFGLVLKEIKIVWSNIIGWFDKQLKWFSNIGEKIGGFITDGIEWAVEKIKSILNWFKDIAKLLYSPIKAVIDKLKPVFSFFKDILLAPLKALKDFVHHLFGNSYILDAINGLKDEIKPVLDFLEDVFLGPFRAVKDFIKGTLGKLVDNLMEKARKLKEWIFGKGEKEEKGRAAARPALSPVPNIYVVADAKTERVPPGQTVVQINQDSVVNVLVQILSVLQNNDNATMGGNMAGTRGFRGLNPNILNQEALRNQGY